ncbi:Apoptosis-stimulating of p53 protein 1 [Operophtera brumata]|uniref:Apoptosis-stimulating of p53 protein 1 n=1 Tax=Operophtera brumata TaxID=104452 RepID=A0A0L7L847_OPEBR|nr:Apoptosis-stimulating of p53 protein 1 [Operophtera brumata]
MIVRVWCESGAGWTPTHVPVTPRTSCRDVLECCREPGDEPCLLLSVHPQHGGMYYRERRGLDTYMATQSTIPAAATCSSVAVTCSSATASRRYAHRQ